MQAAEELTQAVELIGQPETTTAASNAAKVKPAAKAKPAPKAKKPAAPKANVEHVPAAEVLRTLKKLGMTQSAFARAAGVSSSLVCEWVGKGRGKIATRERWATALAAAEQPPKEGA